MPTYITSTPVNRRTTIAEITETPNRLPICPPIKTAIKNQVYSKRLSKPVY